MCVTFTEAKAFLLDDGAWPCYVYDAIALF